MSTGEYNTGKTVAEFVTERPTRSKLFEELGLDYCCGGDRPLEEAVGELDLELSEVTERLSEFDERKAGDSDKVNWEQRPINELIDHIVDRHHGYLREELPRLEKLIAVVHDVHGDEHPELAEVEERFAELQEDLRDHMEKEENVFFPLCRTLSGDEPPSGELNEGLDITDPIERLEDEHSDTDDTLQQIRELTDDFTPPEDACGKYRAMLAGLRELEKDLHLHVHEENHILFPRAADRAREMRQAG